jgi:homoserine trans-succinylase
VKEETRTVTQDIRPLQILVLSPDAGEDRNEDARLFHVSY